MNKLFWLLVIIIGIISVVTLIKYNYKYGVEITKYPIYIAFGFLLSQTFHTLIFIKQKWLTIKGFPAYDISLLFAFKFSILLLIISLFYLMIVNNKIINNPFYIFFIIIPLLIISQVVGRSLIKISFEFSFCFIVFLSLILNKYYSSFKYEYITDDLAKLYYNELWEILKLSIPFLIFWMVNVGIVFAIHFLKSEYFKEHPQMIQYQMFRYGIMFSYSVIGLLFLFYYPLCSKIIYFRKLIINSIS